MDLTTILCWTCAPSCWTWPFPTPYPLWIDSPAASWSQFFRQEGARAALPCNMAGSISVHCVVSVPQCLLPILPSSQFLLVTPFAGILSYAGAQLGVSLGESASLGAFIWFQYLNFPPLCLSSNFLNFLHSLGFNIYNLYPQQLPAFIGFHMWFPRGLPHNFLQASCFNI